MKTYDYSMRTSDGDSGFGLLMASTENSVGPSSDLGDDGNVAQLDVVP